MNDRLSLVPDELWALAEPLIPAQKTGRRAAATRQIEDRAVLAAILYVLTTGCATQRARRVWHRLGGETGDAIEHRGRPLAAVEPAGGAGDLEA